MIYNVRYSSLAHDLDAVNGDYFSGEYEIFNMYGRLVDKQ